VKPRQHLSDDLVTLAERQARTLSREQLRGYGITDRVIHRMSLDGTLERLSLGVYATGEGGWRQLAWAGVLLGGQRAVLGGAAAGHLHGLLKDPPDQILVFGANWRQHGQRWRFSEARRVGAGEPPRTRLAQTVVDLAAELDPDAIVSVVAEAIGRRGLRQAEIRRVLAETTRHPRRALLLDLVGEVVAGSRSPLELRYTREVERAHGLPTARRQEGPLHYGTDVWYEEFGVLVELDGRAYHSGVAALDDMDRDNDHQLVGVITIRLGWRHVARPCQAAAKVARALRAHGWTGRLRPCPRCRTPL
jgi:hypothetical protein